MKYNIYDTHIIYDNSLCPIINREYYFNRVSRCEKCLQDKARDMYLHHIHLFHRHPGHGSDRRGRNLKSVQVSVSGLLITERCKIVAYSERTAHHPALLL